MLLQDITEKRRVISADLLDMAQECRDYGRILSLDISEAPTLPPHACYLYQAMNRSTEHDTIPAPAITRRLPACKTRDRQFIMV